MTAPNPEGDVVLAPCPFCGGAAEIIHLDDGDNAGGSCVACTVCQASGNVEFGFKENFVSNWNRRAAPAALQPSPAAPDGVREEVARAICDFEWDGSQPSFDRKPPAFHARYLAWADAILAALPPVSGGGLGEPVAWRWTETGTDTDGDPRKLTGEYGDYLAVVILSRLSKRWNAHVNNGRGKLGFETQEAARSYAMEVVAGMLALRLEKATETLALYARQQAAPGRERGELNTSSERVSETPENEQVGS